MNLIFQFSYLQVLDLLTTVAFLVSGVKEGNPIVMGIMQLTASPFAALLLIKLLAIGLGVYCWRIRKYRLLGRVNILFAVLVAWNILALIAGTSLSAA